MPYMDDELYMRMALKEAARAADLGEVPIGAVVVYWPHDPATRKPLGTPQVVARSCNLRETTNDPAGHAEFLAMKAAAEVLGVWRLTWCTVYVTLEPCIMCAGLMHQSRVSRCVYGAPDPKAGALGSLYRVNADDRLNHNFEVTPGVLRDECAQALAQFFAQRRAANKQAKKTAQGKASQGYTGLAQAYQGPAERPAQAPLPAGVALTQPAASEGRPE